jgi:hypothetical protein
MGQSSFKSLQTVAGLLDAAALKKFGSQLPRCVLKMIFQGPSAGQLMNILEAEHHRSEI